MVSAAEIIISNGSVPNSASKSRLSYKIQSISPMPRSTAMGNYRRVWPCSMKGLHVPSSLSAGSPYTILGELGQDIKSLSKYLKKLILRGLGGWVHGQLNEGRWCHPPLLLAPHALSQHDPKAADPVLPSFGLPPERATFRTETGQELHWDFWAVDHKPDLSKNSINNCLFRWRLYTISLLMSQSVRRAHTHF